MVPVAAVACDEDADDEVAATLELVTAVLDPPPPQPAGAMAATAVSSAILIRMRHMFAHSAPRSFHATIHA